MSRARLLVLAVVAAACAPRATVSHRLDPVAARVPPMPRGCAELEPGSATRWIVFVQDDCLPCKAWLAELRARRRDLAAARVQVEVAVVGDGHCDEALRVAGAYPFGRRAADAADEAAWVVTSTPVTYRIEGDAIVGRLEGRPPWSSLREAGWLP